MLERYLREDLIFLDWSVSDRKELFKKAATIFLKKGMVDEQFYEFLSKREEDYPTGLQLETHTVAIPHGNPERIKEPFISVVRLLTPIEMNKMDEPDQTLLVNNFFILGLKDGEHHLKGLKKIIGLIQQKEVIDVITEATDTKVVLECLTDIKK